MKKAFPILFIAVTALFSGASAQDKSRIVDHGKAYENSPVELVSCSSGTVVFPGCRDVKGGPDWWLDLKFQLRNISKKTISAFHPDLYLRKTGKMTSGLSMNLVAWKSVRQLADENGWPSGKYGIRIGPGEMFELEVPPAEIKSWRRYLDGFDASDVEQFVLETRAAYFDDGTLWFYGKESELQAGQSSDRSQKLIQQQSRSSSGPVEILGFRANGVPANPNLPFRGDDDWLKDLTVSFKNVSGRALLSVTFQLTFLASFPTGPNSADSITYGLSPRSAAWDLSKMKALPAGSIDELKLEPDHYDRMKRFVSFEEDPADRTTVQIRITDASFADGSKWEYGSYYKPDPARPGEFIREVPPKSEVKPFQAKPEH